MGVLPLLSLLALAAPTVRVHPAPKGEPLSKAFGVSVEGRKPAVYIARVAPGDPARRAELTAYVDKDSPGEAPTDEAAFASWDMSGPVRVTVNVPAAIHSVKILPTSAGIVPKVSGRTLSFTLKTPRPLVIEIDGEIGRSLQLFANPLETNVPKPGDPGVIYFGKGVHEIGHLEVKDGGTVYLAPGAVVRCVVKPGEEGWPIDNGSRRGYPPAFDLQGRGITVRGRGVLDGSLLPVHARNLIGITGQDATLEGIILRDSPTWNVPVRRSDRVTIRNVKVFGTRANSDGFDICNSRDVTVENCFLRTYDDLIVVKTDQGQGEVRGIRVRNCVLWSEFAHALSLGAELREPVSDVRFEDCDVIHDRGREWTLRVFQSDAAKISDVRFERLRIEESRRLASLWIGETVWTRDSQRGHIDNVIFRDIAAASPDPAIELLGFDAGHAVRGVTFDRVRLAGKPLMREAVKTNAFASEIVVTP